MSVMAFVGGRGGTTRPHETQAGMGIILQGESKFNFPLVGDGESRSDCGQILKFKCDDLGAHRNTLMMEHQNHIAVRIVHKSCKRAECPICKKTWAREETKRAVNRYKKHGYLPNFRKRKIIHVILSPSMNDLVKCQNFSELRKKAQKEAKKAGLLGGSLIFHSKHKQCGLCSGEINKKNRCKTCGASQWSWQYYPHFHYLGYGWVDNTHYKNKQKSWLVVNLGVRSQIGGLIYYELSHAAYIGKKHIVSWFGCMSYNSFKCPKLEKKPKKCPICGQEMTKFYSMGTFPKKDGVYYYTNQEFEEKNKPPDHNSPEEREKFNVYFDEMFL